MKALCTLTFLLCALASAWSQYRILGFVYDAEEEPYAGIEVRLRGEEVKQTTFTDEHGRFEFFNVPRGIMRVVVITGYGLIEKEVNVRTSIEMHLQRPRNIRTDEVVVSGVRAEKEAPLTFTNVGREEINARNLGADVPYVLGMTPSLVETSDAGTGIGYTGMRIRGTDPSRINVTINGVPLNDAESQQVYWVDLPDLMTSTQSVQIQRGVGASTFGSGAFGASVNINTVNTFTDPHAAVSLTGGSFGTYRTSVSGGTGLMASHFTVDARLSLINSDGYIDRASADLKSWYATAAYITAGQSVRLNAFGGNEVTYQAWNGVPAQYINDPVLRTFNTAGTEKPGVPYDNEVDDYAQTHLQLLWNASIFTQLQAYATMHYTKGSGFYEQYKGVEFFDSTFSRFLMDNGLDDGDAIRRRWLDNDFYGGIAGLHFFDPSEKFSVRLGGAWHHYNGDHFGEVIWSEAGSVGHLPEYYRNDARKSDRSGFIKFNYAFAPELSGMLDLQLRGVRYKFEGLDIEGRPFPQEVRHHFFNPKAGLSWSLDAKSRIYTFLGIAQREPNRDDYIASTTESRPRAEKLYNAELGWEFQSAQVRCGLTGYYMYYDDQLVLTGRINDVGEYARQNIDKSSRAGLEAFIGWADDKWDTQVTATLSRNRVKAFDEYIDDWDNVGQFVISHANTPLAFSPGVIVSTGAGYHILKDTVQDLRIGAMFKYVGDQYIDNTGNDASLLDGYATTDLQVTYGRNIGKTRVEAHLLVRNLFDHLYSSNAWIYRFNSSGYDPRPDDPYAEFEQGTTYHQKGLFPQAGRSLLAGVTLSF